MDWVVVYRKPSADCTAPTTSSSAEIHLRTNLDCEKAWEITCRPDQSRKSSVALCKTTKDSDPLGQSSAPFGSDRSLKFVFEQIAVILPNENDLGSLHSACPAHFEIVFERLAILERKRTLLRQSSRNFKVTLVIRLPSIFVTDYNPLRGRVLNGRYVLINVGRVKALLRANTLLPWRMEL